MSKIGKLPVEIPAQITVSIVDREIIIKGAKAENRVPLLEGVEVRQEGNILEFVLSHKTKQTKSNWGTVRALTQNAIDGLSKGFEKTLILEGVGYKIMKEGNGLNLSLGFSHPVKYEAPEGIEFELGKNNTVTIKGFKKDLVGQVAAELRAMKKPEPYKGKGFRYSNEVIRRKAGKKASSGS